LFWKPFSITKNLKSHTTYWSGLIQYETIYYCLLCEFIRSSLTLSWAWNGDVLRVYNLVMRPADRYASQPVLVLLCMPDCG